MSVGHAVFRPMGLGRQAALILVLLGLAACNKRPSPEASFRAFVAAAAAGDHDSAWAKLSQETRAQANAMVKAAAPLLKAAGQTGPKDGEAFLFGQGLDLVREVDQIDEIDRSVEAGQQRAHLKVTDSDGHSLVLEMRLEQGRWHLHLPLNDGPRPLPPEDRPAP